MDNNEIQLDGAPFEKAMQPVLNSLKEFRALVVALDQAPTGKLKAEMQAMKTSFAGLAGELEKSLTTLPNIMAKQVAEATGQVNKQMRKAGEAAGKEFADGTIKSVRAEKQRVQAEYEAMVSKGWTLKVPAIQAARASGVTLFPDDAARLKAVSDSAQASAGVLATQRRFTAAASGKRQRRARSTTQTFLLMEWGISLAWKCLTLFLSIYLIFR